MVLIYDQETTIAIRQLANAPVGTELVPRFRKTLQREIYSQRAENSEIRRIKRFMGKSPGNHHQYRWWLMN